MVHWDQAPLPGGGEPEHPAPMLTLTAAAPEGAQHTTESTARWLGGAGIVAGVLAVGLALVMRRRS